jgi:hypothetical protein
LCQCVSKIQISQDFVEKIGIKPQAIS